MCECAENAEHYFFKCSHYKDIRTSLFRATRAFHPLSVHKLLFGIANLSHIQNCLLFEAVHLYIKDSKRFVYFFCNSFTSFLPIRASIPHRDHHLVSYKLSLSLFKSLLIVCVCMRACVECVCMYMGFFPLLSRIYMPF